MIDVDNIRKIIIAGLKKHLQIPIIRSNQTGDPPPYPYLSYTIVSPKQSKGGSWGQYDDEIDRKPITQTWSITIQSDDDSEALNLTLEAHDWLDHIGTTYLNDNNIIVQSVSDINNRDNFLTIEYEYRKGFDIVLWLLDEVENPIEEAGYIETVTVNGEDVDVPRTTEQLFEQLGERLSGR